MLTVEDILLVLETEQNESKVRILSAIYHHHIGMPKGKPPSKSMTSCRTEIFIALEDSQTSVLKLIEMPK